MEGEVVVFEQAEISEKSGGEIPILWEGVGVSLPCLLTENQHSHFQDHSAQMRRSVGEKEYI